MTAQRIKQIFDHYGRVNRLEKMVEEAQQLKEAANFLLYLIKAYQGEDRDERIVRAGKHLADEITDVRIMSDQLEYGLSLTHECDYQRTYKLERQIKRIEKKNE